jgi:uncharacterized OB-fold protein
MTTIAKDRAFPAPNFNPETEDYWKAAREDRLLLRRGKSGQPHFYPRAICPFDMSDTEWFEATGRGSIYSFSVMRRAPVVYAIGYVTLDEGVSMLTNFVDCDLDALRIGMAVRVVFKPTDGGDWKLPCFTPA